MVLASIQCRLGSKRLPGKILKKIENKTILEILLNRIKKSKQINKIIVNTSTSKQDDLIVEFCKKRKIEVFRGDEKRVFDRIKDLIKKNNNKNYLHVELFGDCPLIDYRLIDQIIKIAKKSKKFDVISNAFETTFPPGQELIVFKSKSFLQLDKLLPNRNAIREHGASNFIKFSKKFKILSIRASKIYNFPSIYLELDTNDDLKLLKNIYLNFKKRFNFSLKDILEYLLKNKIFYKKNKNIFRRWKKHRKGFVARYVKYI